MPTAKTSILPHGLLEPIFFRNGEEKHKCLEIVKALTEEELEQAAETSYAYSSANQRLSQEENDSQEDLSSELKDAKVQIVERMARRHLIAEKGNETKALEKLKETLEFRQTKRINEIRSCFSPDLPKEDTTMVNIRDAILADASPSPKMTIRGYDKSQRAILLKFHHTKFTCRDEDLFLSVQMYWIERALACTERCSNGKEEKINLAIDYDGYSRENKPPISLVRKLVGMLQAHYPERMHLWIACDPTLILRTVWSIVSLFVDAKTREKTKFVTGNEAKIEQLSPYIDASQAMPFLLPNGRLDAELSPETAKRFLMETPFDRNFDGE